jgi:hypothetical protein
MVDSSIALDNPLRGGSPSNHRSLSSVDSHVTFCSSFHPLDKWYYMVLTAPCLADGVTATPPGLIELPSTNTMSGSVYLFQDWIQAWNTTFYRHQGRIINSCPLLYLYSFICFHRVVWKIAVVIPAYVFLIFVFFFVKDGLSPEMVVILAVSGIGSLVLAPVTVKGSYNAESIRSEPIRCSKSWNRRYTPSNLSKNLSLPNSIYAFLKLASTSSSDVTMLRDEDIEASKFLNLQDPVSVPGIYHYLEAMTGFLQDSSCTSYSYKPPTAVTSMLRFSFYVTLAFPVLMWLYRWFTYYMFCGAGMHLSSEPDLPPWCVASTWQFFFLLGAFLLIASLMILSLTYLTVLAMILYTAHLMISLMKFWIQRYKVLRLLQRSDLEAELEQTTGTEDVTNIAEGMDPDEALGVGLQENLQRRRKTILRSVERDAHERYLLVHYFAQEISIQWGPFLACSLAMNAVCCVGGYFFLFILYTNYGYLDLVSLCVIVFNVIILLFIMITIAYANSNVDHLKSHFIQSAEEDYSLIGGRAAWLQYIDQTPVYWTIFGLAITPTWIASIFATIVTGVLGVVGAPFIS